MAVTNVSEIHNGRDGSTTLSRDGRSIRTYSRVFRVITDSNYTEAATIKASLPRVGGTHPYDIDAYCESVVVRQQDNSKRVWVATCSYTTEREIQENPLDEPARITWGTEPYQRPFYVDRDGNKICVASGEPVIDPPVMGDASRITVTVSKNVAGVPSWILTYRDAVNADGFAIGGLSIASGKAKIMRWDIGELQERNDVAYYVFTYVMALNDDGWAVEVPNVGFMEKDPDDAAKRIPIEVDGEVTQAPWPLDAGGAAIDDPTETSLVTLSFDIYPERTFGGYLPMS